MEEGESMSPLLSPVLLAESRKQTDRDRNPAGKWKSVQPRTCQVLRPSEGTEDTVTNASKLRASLSTPANRWHPFQTYKNSKSPKAKVITFDQGPRPRHQFDPSTPPSSEVEGSRKVGDYFFFLSQVNLGSGSSLLKYFILHSANEIEWPTGFVLIRTATI